MARKKGGGVERGLAAPQDVAIIGGGIVGLATAYALSRLYPERRLLVIEKEPALARHQSGHNSGVLHSGLYYEPGSLKAKLAVAGAAAMRRFCQEEGLPCILRGKVVVATAPEELPRLDELERRARANGVPDIERIGPDGIREREPEVRALSALWVPGSGCVDFRAVALRYAERIEEKGHRVALGCRFLGARRRRRGWLVLTDRGDFEAGFLIGCAGLHADRVALRSGARPGLKIVPFRGEYVRIRPERAGLVRGLIYPVPDPAFPFLGVHLTRRVDGRVDAGPNAVAALAREGYRKTSFHGRDAAEALSYQGVWRLAARTWRTALREQWRSWSRRALLASIRRLIPAMELEDLEEGGAGVRAQALAADGSLIRDFRIIALRGAVHVLNAPSPAATASLLIGEHIARRAAEQWRD